MFSLWMEAQDKAGSPLDNNQNGFMAESELSWRTLVFDMVHY